MGGRDGGREEGVSKTTHLLGSVKSLNFHCPSIHDIHNVVNGNR